MRHLVASPLTKPASDDCIPDDLVLWRLSIDQYHAMVAADILGEDDPVELLEGLLVYKMSKNPPHTFVTQQLRFVLEALASSEWFINDQEPITLDTSEPEPDVSVVRGQRRDYLRRHPKAQDVALVVEVAEADQGAKKRIYARAGIPVYWVVNLVDQRIEVYSNPSGSVTKPDYLTQQFYAHTDEIPVVLAGTTVGTLAVQELLP
jgi:Uma2 family endonuclease